MIIVVLWSLYYAAITLVNERVKYLSRLTLIIVCFYLVYYALSHANHLSHCSYIDKITKKQKTLPESSLARDTDSTIAIKKRLVLLQNIKKKYKLMKQNLHNFIAKFLSINLFLFFFSQVIYLIVSYTLQVSFYG